MAAIFGGGPKPPAPPPPPPQVDDAASRLNEADRMARKQGRRASILTDQGGLPNLGTVKAPQQ